MHNTTHYKHIFCINFLRQAIVVKKEKKTRSMKVPAGLLLLHVVVGCLILVVAAVVALARHACFREGLTVAAVVNGDVASLLPASALSRPPQNAVSCAGTPVKWNLDKAGDMSRLHLVHVPPCQVDSDFVRVSVRFVGLNFADVCACQGLYSATPSGAFTPGLEFSGIVAEVGADVRHVKVGDAVMGVARFGGYAQEIVVDNRQLFHVPEGWTLSDAAAFLCTSLTAWYGLHKIGHVQSAAGGVGLAATEIVLSMGAVPLCIVGSESKVDFLLKR